MDVRQIVTALMEAHHLDLEDVELAQFVEDLPEMQARSARLRVPGVIELSALVFDPAAYYAAGACAEPDQDI